MSLRLTEQHGLANSRNMLYVEERESGDGAFLIICGADEDPNQSGVGEPIELNREQVADLMRYLGKLLTA